MKHKKFLELLPELYDICKITGTLQVKHHKTDILFKNKSNQTPVTEVDIQSSLIIINDNLDSFLSQKWEYLG